MAFSKRGMIATAAVAAVGMAGVSGVGLASAATTSDGSVGTSIVDKIATKFGLNTSDVQAVFDENRAEHKADMQQRIQERLAQAVTDGKLTQEQADYIKQVQSEIQTLMGDTNPRSLDDATRDQIKTKLDDLRSWAQTNNIDTKYVGGGMGMGHEPHGDGGMPEDAPDAVETSAVQLN